LNRSVSKKSKIIAVILLVGVLPLLVSLASSLFIGNAKHIDEPLHEFFELTGSCIAITVAMLLLLRLRHEEKSTHLLWAVAALVAMGLVDGLHGIHGISLFSWQRHGATLFGGLLFGLVWLPLPPAVTRRKEISVLMVAGLSLALGLFWGSGWMPLTWDPSGLYTFPVKALNGLGGLGFLAAALFFCRRYLKQSQSEDLVFASLTVLFGVASLLFGVAHTWAADWWVWHGFRLLAYAIVLVAAYGMAITLFRQKAAYTQELEGRVQERVADLRQTNEALLGEITERKQAEEALRETNEYLENLFNHANAPIIVWDNHFHITRFNGAFEALTGRRASEVTGKSLEILFPPAHVKSSMNLIKKTLKGERWEVVEIEILHVEGSIRTVLWNSATILALDGKTPIATIAQGQDITERKRAEEALTESEKKLRTLFETMSEGIVYEDHAGNIISANPAAERLLGLSLDQMQGRTSLDPRWQSIHEDGSPFPGETHSLRVAAMTGKPGHDEIQGIYNPKSGTYIWLNINSTPEFLPGEKEPYRAYAVFRDITERKQAEKQLKALNENLERSNRELEQFAYVASHDLQEPLRMVSSYTQLLEQRYKDKLDQDAQDFIGYAVDGANRMQRLIQDLLEYSRITTRGQPLALLDSHEVLGEAIKNLQVAIQESGALVTSNDLPIVLGDRTQIVQVFQNLIGNGIKFQRPDVAPLIHISTEDDLHDNRFRLFRVSDNGIGIEPRHFNRLFEIFQRLNSKKEYPGTGIGLALCKRIIERHGGRIWVESEPGKGSTFLFTLPAEDHNNKGEQK
jgi:PAS domain S-box-containing protein